MAFYETINLVKGDTLPELNLTLRDSNTAAPGYTLSKRQCLCPNIPLQQMAKSLCNGLLVRLIQRELLQGKLKLLLVPAAYKQFLIS